MTIHIQKIIGQRCITKEHGQTIYQTIHQPLKEGKTITLDYTNTTITTPTYHNNAIAPLLKDIPETNIKNNLKIKNLSQNGHNIIKHIIENAKNYYTNPNRHQINL